MSKHDVLQTIRVVCLYQQIQLSDVSVTVKVCLIAVCDELESENQVQRAPTAVAMFMCKLAEPKSGQKLQRRG